MLKFLTFLALVSTSLVSAAQTDGPVDFKRDIAPVFEARCVFCHSVGGHQAGGLFLETEHAEENLVRVESYQKAGMLRVAPGDVEASYLIKKLRGDLDIVGARMPPGFYPPLELDVMDKLKLWIQQLKD